MVTFHTLHFIVELLIHCGHAVRGDLPENIDLPENTGMELGPEGQFAIATDPDTLEVVANLMQGSRSRPETGAVGFRNTIPKDGAMLSLLRPEAELTVSNQTREDLNRSLSNSSSRSAAPQEVSPPNQLEVVSKFEASSSAVKYGNSRVESVHRRRAFHEPEHALSYQDGMPVLPKAEHAWNETAFVEVSSNWDPCPEKLVRKCKRCPVPNLDPAHCKKCYRIEKGNPGVKARGIVCSSKGKLDGYCQSSTETPHAEYCNVPPSVGELEAKFTDLEKRITKLEQTISSSSDEAIVQASEVKSQLQSLETKHDNLTKEIARLEEMLSASAAHGQDDE